MNHTESRNEKTIRRAFADRIGAAIVVLFLFAFTSALAVISAPPPGPGPLPPIDKDYGLIGFPNAQPATAPIVLSATEPLIIDASADTEPSESASEKQPAATPPPPPPKKLSTKISEADEKAAREKSKKSATAQNISSAATPTKSIPAQKPIGAKETKTATTPTAGAAAKPKADKSALVYATSSAKITPATQKPATDKTTTSPATSATKAAAPTKTRTQPEAATSTAALPSKKQSAKVASVPPPGKPAPVKPTQKSAATVAASSPAPLAKARPAPEARPIPKEAPIPSQAKLPLPAPQTVLSPTPPEPAPIEETPPAPIIHVAETPLAPQPRPEPEQEPEAQQGPQFFTVRTPPYSSLEETESRIAPLVGAGYHPAIRKIEIESGIFFYADMATLPDRTLALDFAKELNALGASTYVTTSSVPSRDRALGKRVDSMFPHIGAANKDQLNLMINTFPPDTVPNQPDTSNQHAGLGGADQLALLTRLAGAMPSSGASAQVSNQPPAQQDNSVVEIPPQTTEEQQPVPTIRFSARKGAALSTRMQDIAWALRGSGYDVELETESYETPDGTLTGIYNNVDDARKLGEELVSYGYPVRIIQDQGTPERYLVFAAVKVTEDGEEAWLPDEAGTAPDATATFAPPADSGLDTLLRMTQGADTAPKPRTADPVRNSQPDTRNPKLRRGTPSTL